MNRHAINIFSKGKLIMKKLLLSTTVAVAAFATAAFATDLPSKKTAPAAPVAAAASADSLSISYGQDFVNGSFGTKSSDAYGVAYTHKIDALSVGAAISTSQNTSNTVKQNIEAQVGYSQPLVAGVTATAKVGVGQRFETTNFPYFALYGAADYKLNDDLTLNAVGYRYRSAVDSAANGYQSHQLSTGVTYALSKTYSVSAKVARNWDKDYNTTGDAATIALNIKF